MEFQEFQVILCFLGPSMFYNKFETYCKALSQYYRFNFLSNIGAPIKNGVNVADLSPLFTEATYNLATIIVIRDPSQNFEDFNS